MRSIENAQANMGRFATLVPIMHGTETLGLIRRVISNYDEASGCVRSYDCRQSADAPRPPTRDLDERLSGWLTRHSRCTHGLALALKAVASPLRGQAGSGPSQRLCLACSVQAIARSSLL